MDAVACVLHELYNRGLHGILAGDVEVQFDELVPVEAVIRADDVGIELKQIVVFEDDEVIGIVLLELFAFFGHALDSQACRHCGIVGLGRGCWLGEAVPFQVSVQMSHTSSRAL